MMAVAKQVKKALNESADTNNYNHWDEEDKYFCNYDQIPKKYKDDDNRWILFEKMNRDEIKQFIANMNWFYPEYPDESILTEGLINHYDKIHTCGKYSFESYFNYNKYEGYIAIPYLNDTFIHISATFDWDVTPYDRGNYWTPPSGEDHELNNANIDNIVLYYRGTAYRFNRNTDNDLYNILENKILEYLCKEAEDRFDYDEYADDRNYQFEE